MAKKHKSKTRRKTQYDQLRAVGFTSKEANRYKDYSDYKISLMIESKQYANAEIECISRGGKE